MLYELNRVILKKTNPVAAKYFQFLNCFLINAESCTTYDIKEK